MASQVHSQLTNTRTRMNNRAHDREDQSPRTPFTLASFSCSRGESTRKGQRVPLPRPREPRAHRHGSEWPHPAAPGSTPGRQYIQHLIKYDIIIINTHHTLRVRITIQPEQMLLRTRTFTTHTKTNTYDLFILRVLTRRDVVLASSSPLVPL